MAPELRPLAAGALLLALAAAALLAARRRRRVPRLVELVESASLGPKRSLVVARLGDELLVLGASEGGISLLATRPAPAPAAVPAEEGPAAAPTVAARLPGAAPTTTRAVSRVAALLGRLRRRRAAPPTFEELLVESGEDEELRRKLAAGQVGWVR
jgi:flagellar protein FliO/FliZ